MLNFLRKFRRNNINGKPALPSGRYFKYAIGEIFLVVIGILIAVQINELNESRKNQQKIRLNASLLIESLEADSLKILEWKEKKAEDLKTIDDFKARINSPSATIDTLIQIAQNEYRPWITTVEFNKDVAFKTMVASGEVNLFDRNMVENIYSLYSFQAAVLKRNENSFNTYLSHLRSFVQRYTFNEANIVTQGPLYDKLWGNVDEADLIGKFNAMAGHKYVFYRQVDAGMVSIEESISDLLPQLRQLEK